FVLATLGEVTTLQFDPFQCSTSVLAPAPSPLLLLPRLPTTQTLFVATATGVFRKSFLVVGLGVETICQLVPFPFGDGLSAEAQPRGVEHRRNRLILFHLR